MNIENIKVGDKFSTLTKLLTTVGFDKYSGGKQKKYQLRELNRYLTYEKTGKISRGKPTNEIVITEIYDTPKKAVDNRSNNGGNSTKSKSINDKRHKNKGIPIKSIDNKKIEFLNKHTQFQFTKETMCCGGVYKIQYSNNIYIGSTKNFYNRFKQHISGNMKNTKKLLDMGATMTALVICDKTQTKEDLKRIEFRYIRQYNKNNNFILYNHVI